MGERPWIEHDGKGCPVAKGARLSAKFLNPIIGTIEIKDGVAGSGQGRSWVWVRDTPEWYDGGLIGQIIAYRLHDDGAEAARRAERMAEWNRIADEAVKTDKPVRAPQKERV
jgi:hypothetical protein